MPRTIRQKSQTGIYHVMLRGINQQLIFNDEEDYEKFIEILTECKKISEFKIYAYCLMSNHVHLLIKEEKEPLSQIIKRVGVRYVYWYNWKYNRRGHLFQDRYKSETVDNESFLLTVLRYIHQNPIKAGIVYSAEKYKYSSYGEYLKKSTTLLDNEFVEEIIGKDEFIRYHNEQNNDICMDYDYLDNRITDEDGRDIIRRISKCKNVEEFLNLNTEKQNKYIQMFKQKGMSIRQISRLTGVSFGLVRKI